MNLISSYCCTNCYIFLSWFRLVCAKQDIINLFQTWQRSIWVSLLQLVGARGLGNTLIIFRWTHISQAGLTQGGARQRRASFLVSCYNLFPFLPSIRTQTRTRVFSIFFHGWTAARFSFRPGLVWCLGSFLSYPFYARSMLQFPCWFWFYFCCLLQISFVRFFIVHIPLLS